MIASEDIPSPGGTSIRNPVRLSIRGSAIEYFRLSLENLYPDIASIDQNCIKRKCKNSYSHLQTLAAPNEWKRRLHTRFISPEGWTRNHLDRAPHSKLPALELSLAKLI